tara:strand:- start:59 stop:790 length:732 start_codon:yes stop_codon:yes gene_type:complete
MNNKTTIQSTSDLSVFRKIEGNRPLSEAKIKKMILSVKSGIDFFEYCPILVDSKMRVIDGQHRLEACRRLKKDVFYIQKKGVAKIEEVSTLNSANSGWSTPDFIDSYAAQGNPNYIHLKTLKASYKIGYGAISSFLSNGVLTDGGGSVTKKVRDGDFKISHMDEAVEFLNFISSVRPYFTIINTFTLRAIIKVYRVEDFSAGSFSSKLIKIKRKVPYCPSVKDALKEIETVYNFRRKERIILY